MKIKPIEKPKVERVPFEVINKHDAARILGVSTDTLKVYRREGLLQENLHYFCWNSRTTRYNKFLIEDWARNKGYPELHQLAIDQYVSSLPSGQQKQVGRPAKMPASVS